MQRWKAEESPNLPQMKEEKRKQDFTSPLTPKSQKN
jgi:hypothetical protein